MEANFISDRRDRGNRDGTGPDSEHAAGLHDRNVKKDYPVPYDLLNRYRFIDVTVIFLDIIGNHDCAVHIFYGILRIFTVIRSSEE